jgi:hypothetical protein
VLEYESMLDIHHYSLLYKPCWLSKPSACARVDHTSERERVSFFTVVPLPSPEKVCVASSSLGAFWFCYSILKSPEKNIKTAKKTKKEAKKKARDNIEGALSEFFFSFVRWCFLITLVSRLASLAQSSLGPAYYHH